MAGIDERKKVLCKAAPSATLLVYGPRAGQGIGTSAADLARVISGTTLTTAVAVAQTPTIEIRADMNEQKVLWSMARNFAEFVKKNPPKEDYVLFADYLMGKDPQGKVGVGGVHFAICNRAGDLVVVDFQNNHHEDFQAINPTSPEDCDKLVARRLAKSCKL